MWSFCLLLWKYLLILKVVPKASPNFCSGFPLLSLSIFLVYIQAGFRNFQNHRQVSEQLLKAQATMDKWTKVRTSKQPIGKWERPRWTTRQNERAYGSASDAGVTSRSGRSPERPYLDHGGLHTKYPSKYQKAGTSSLKRVITGRNFTISKRCHRSKQKLHFGFPSQKDNRKLWKPLAVIQKVLFRILGHAPRNRPLFVLPAWKKNLPPRSESAVRYRYN